MSRIPTTLEDAVALLKFELPEETRQSIREDLSLSPVVWHHTMGQAVRNDFGLWLDSPLAKHFEDRFGLGHADDMSAIILDALFADIRGLPYDPENAARHYRDYWTRQGVSPRTLRKGEDLFDSEALEAQPKKRDWLAWLGFRKSRPLET